MLRAAVLAVTLALLRETEPGCSLLQEPAPDYETSPRRRLPRRTRFRRLLLLESSGVSKTVLQESICSLQ